MRELYDTHVDRVFRLTFRMVGDEDTAQDCTQDAFVKAFRGLDSFRSDSRFSTWIHSIAVHSALNRLRTHKRTRGREVDMTEMPLADSGSRPTDPTLKDRIRTAVDGLSEIYRTVFLMHDVEGYKHSEIAESLDIAVGTSKARLFRARDALRKALGDEVREYVS